MLASGLLLLAMQWPVLAYPGVNYDEVMWVNVALDTGNLAFIHDAIKGWPLMLMPYIGAFKGYIYKAIFTWVDPSVVTLRAPMLLLAGAGIALFSAAVYRYCDRWAGRFVFLFLLLNPLVGMHSALDLGPSNIEFFLKCSALFLLLRSALDRKPLNAGLLGAIFLFGMWNKLSFVWFLNSVFLLWIILFSASRRSVAVENRAGSKVNNGLFQNRFDLIVFLPSYIVFALVFYFNIYLGVKAPVEEANYLPMKAYYFFDLFSGISYYNWGWVLRSSVFYILCSFTCLGFVLAAIHFAVRDVYRCWRIKTDVLSLPALAVGNILACVIGLASFAQFVLTREAIQPWHAYTLFPVLPALVATGAVLCFKSFDKNAGFYSKLLIAFAMVFIVVVGLVARIDIAKNISQVQHGKYSWARVANSNVSGEVFNWLKSVDQKVKFLDWGFMTQALFFDHLKSAKYDDLSWTYNAGDDLENFLSLDQSAIFVTHGELTSAYLDARANFFKSAKLAGVDLCEVKSFSDADGIVFAQAWKMCGKDKAINTSGSKMAYAFNYSADVELSNAAFTVKGNDPQVYFSAQDLAGMTDLKAVAFKFQCMDKRSDPALQIFFKSAGSAGFTEQLSVKVTPVKDLVYLDVSRLKLNAQIDFQEIRIDLDPATSCAAFSIGDLRAYGKQAR